MTATNRSGLIFEREIKEGAKAFSIHIRKLPVSQGVRESGGSYKIDSAYDLFAVYDGVPAAIECKASRVFGLFPFARVQKHQVEALSEMKNAGGVGVILICYGTGRKKRAFILDIDEYLRLRDSGDRKSLSLEQVLSLPELERIRGGWDIRIIFRRSE